MSTPSFQRGRRAVIASLLGYSAIVLVPRFSIAIPPGSEPVPTQTVDPDAYCREIPKLLEALGSAGTPVDTADSDRLHSLCQSPTSETVHEIEQILNRYTLVRLQLDAHGIGQSSAGGADRRLNELGWRSFLVRVENSAGLKGPLSFVSRHAIPEGELGVGIHESHILGNDQPEITPAGIDLDTDFDSDTHAWLGFHFGVGTGSDAGLTGLPLEYQILQLYSQGGGSRTTAVGACLKAIPGARRVECKGFDARFDCDPASPVTLNIRDADGAGTTAGLFIRDAIGRIYPAPAHRIEPDLCYQPQIYRSDTEGIRLPQGRYTIVASRGPEYLKSETPIVVLPGGAATSVTLNLERWIDPTKLGWYPGEPHLHPEGQIYGIVSKYGLTPETLLRQVRGEALSVGSVLIWTYGYYYEKQFLTGSVYQAQYRLPFTGVQEANNSSFTPKPAAHDADTVIRYDAEQAAFPSNRAGHLILLRLKRHDYPDAKSVYDWPSWNLPILRWAREQGAVAGYAHVGNGMSVNSTQLPNYEIPPLEGLGANEMLVDVTHGLVDFAAGGESHPVVDLNVWYHLLNCGFFIPMIGETDFPVGAGTRRVGTVRTYVGLDTAPHGDAGYDAWVEGIKAGRLYFGDGRSHIFDLRVNGQPLGAIPLELAHPGAVTLSAKIAARLEEHPVDPQADPQALGFAHWHIERARIGDTRKVALEVVVNGYKVERQDILADGQIRDVSVSVHVPRSSWVALRILPSVHSAPVMVSVAKRPVRASKRSAQWCLDCIETYWQKHSWRIRQSEREAAEKAWDHARSIYKQIISECLTD